MDSLQVNEHVWMKMNMLGGVSSYRYGHFFCSYINLGRTVDGAVHRRGLRAGISINAASGGIGEIHVGCRCNMVQHGATSKKVFKWFLDVSINDGDQYSHRCWKPSCLWNLCEFWTFALLLDPRCWVGKHQLERWNLSLWYLMIWETPLHASV